MPTLTRRSALAGTIASLAASRAGASDAVRLKISVDYGLYGANAPILLAQAGGGLPAAGIEATVDGSAGSGDAINRVASGAYDACYADIGTLAEFATRQPSLAPKLVMPVLDRTASAIVSLKRANITRFADLAGKRIGTGQSDASARLFPALLRLNGLSVDQVKLVPVEQRLRDTMLLRGEVDAVLGFDTTIVFNLKTQKIPLEDLTIMGFADNGFDFYGNGLLVSRRLVDTMPDVVTRLTRAVAAAWIASVRDPAPAIAALKAREPLTDPAIETDRLRWIVSRSVLTAATRRSGFGALDREKMDRGLQTLATGFGLSKVPTTDDIFDARFMPSAEDRALPT